MTTIHIAPSSGGTLGVHLWTGDHIAEIRAKSGLFEWMMHRII